MKRHNKDLMLAQNTHQHLRTILSSMMIRGVVIIHSKNTSAIIPECIEDSQAHKLKQSLSSLAVTAELFRCHDEKIMRSITQNGLGIERNDVIFDATLGFDLTAFAAIAGSLKSGAILWVVLPELSIWKNSSDITSLRWNEPPYAELDNPQAIIPLNFISHFQYCCTQHSAIYSEPASRALDLNHISEFTQHILQPYIKILERFKEQFNPSTKDLNFFLKYNSNVANDEQSYIIEQCIKEPVDLNLLFAKRGRGKSWLLTELIRRLNILGIHSYLTISNKNANRSAALKTNNFIAPDELTRLCLFHESKALAPIAQWLLVDEAAMLPLSQIKSWLPHFKYVLLVTTVDGYEGSGQGLRFKLNTIKSSPRVFTLNQPIRYSSNDPLEHFVEQLCILPNRRSIESFKTDIRHLQNLLKVDFEYPAKSIHFKLISPQLHNVDINEISDLYQLLYSAHYKTTPTDLRRILDVPNQQFIIGYQEDSQIRARKNIIAGCWILDEGGADLQLAKNIWAGRRRPKGNLVAQSLTAHAGLLKACILNSWRISRIAVDDNYRRNYLSTKMLNLLKESAIKRNIDYISVSFGYEDGLYKFWEANQFSLVHLSFREDASSGSLSCMMIYPLSLEGVNLLDCANKYLTDYVRNEFSVQSRLDAKRSKLIKKLIQSRALDVPIKINIRLEQSELYLLLGFAKHNRSVNTIFPVLSTISNWNNLTKYDNKWNENNLALTLTLLDDAHAASKNININHNKQLVIKKIKVLLLDWLQTEYPDECEKFDNWMINCSFD